MFYSLVYSTRLSCTLSPALGDTLIVMVAEVASVEFQDVDEGLGA